MSPDEKKETVETAPEGEQPSTREEVSASTADGDQPLFSEEEKASLPPDIAKRVKGMEAAFTRRQQQLAKATKDAEEARASLSEQVQTMKSAMEETPAPAAEKKAGKLSSILERARPEDRGAIQELVEAIREEMRSDIAPIAGAVSQASYNSQVDRARVRYSDFDQVVNQQSLGALLDRYPNLTDVDAAYKILKHDAMEKDLSRKDVELKKLQEQAKLRATTERPAGFSTEGGGEDWYEKLPKEQRRKLTMKQLMDKAEESLRGR